jgi:head-tail adaptor
MGLATFLSGGTINQLRGLAWLALGDLGQVGTATITSDSGGGGTAVWSYGGTIACRIDPITGGEQMAADRLSDRSTHTVTVPPGTAITTAARFAIAGRGTYEVTAVRSRTDEPMTFFEVVQAS